MQIDLDAELHRQLKMAAAARDMTIKALVIEAIGEKCQEVERSLAPKKPRKRR